MEYLLFIQISIIAGASAAFIRYSTAILIVPILILIWNIEPVAAVCAGLITDFFYLLFISYPKIKQKTIDYSLSIKMLLLAMPAAVFGAWIACKIPGNYITVLLITGLVIIACTYFYLLESETIEELDQTIVNKYGATLYQTQITKADGYYHRYSANNLAKSSLLFMLGGLSTGMLALFLGKYSKNLLLRLSEVPSEVSAATATFIQLAVTLIASLICIFMFYAGESTMNPDIWIIVLFAAPGAILGAYLSLLIISENFLNNANTSIPAILIVLALLLLVKVISA